MDKDRVITEAVEKDDPAIISNFLNCSIEDILQSRNDSNNSYCAADRFNKLDSIGCNDMECSKCMLNNDNDKAINWLKKGIKELTVDDLVDGEFYFTGPGLWHYIIRYTKNKNNTYAVGSDWFTRNYSNPIIHDGVDGWKLRLATESEKKWLKTCIKQNKYILESELDKYDDEGNLIENKSEFEVGKWYSFDWSVISSSNKQVVCKVSSVDTIIIEMYWIKYLYNDSTSYNSAYFLNDISNIKELSLEEVQQYLPEGHMDLISKSSKSLLDSKEEFNEDDITEEVCKWCEKHIIGGCRNTFHYQCEGSHCKQALEDYKDRLNMNNQNVSKVEYTSTPIEPKYLDCDSLTDILIDFSKPAGSKMLDPIAWINADSWSMDGLHPSENVTDVFKWSVNQSNWLLVPNKYNYKYYEPEDDPIVHTWYFQRESIKYSDL